MLNSRPHSTIYSALLAAATLLLASCSTPNSATVSAPKQPRLVLLYAMCSLNKDFLSPYNDAVVYTPNLQALAEKSVVFQRHISESGQSGISYASLFSGTQAHRHGVYRHPTRLEDDLYLISEAYVEGGYQPYFWNVHQLAGHELNYAQGIPAPYVARKPLTKHRKPFLSLLDQLKTNGDGRAFVMTNYSTTHSLYDTFFLEEFLNRYPGEQGDLPDDVVQSCLGKKRPRGCNELYATHVSSFQYDLERTIERFGLSHEEVLQIARLEELLYKANVHWLDQLFGDVVAEVEQRGLMDEALIVLTADHGEILHRKNALFHWTHGQALAPEVLNVPWLIHAPDLAGTTYEDLTRSIDVFPTMMGLSNLELPKDHGVEGIDLSRALRGEAPPPDLLAFSHTTMPMEGTLATEGYAGTFRASLFPNEEVGSIWVSIRQRDMVYKWRHFGDEEWGFETFDLHLDPFEQNNLFDEHHSEHRKMAQRLVEYKNLLINSHQAEEMDPASRDEKRNLLRSLGYL